ncbi:endonuclease domain-containing protein [Arthrobacter sp. RIT-PI-e]|uniref:endonuclease domain-containing protein n=1 Tax=Arthrobacter sp. RIT-PI-e TaxID=1681197 RepID=UPI0006761BE8|nr:DUF559 domain-containing protein [Arthrobacter sp. RIT-PI-e]
MDSAEAGAELVHHGSMQTDPMAAALLSLGTARCFTVERARGLGIPPSVLRRTGYQRHSRSLRSVKGIPAEVSDVVTCLGSLVPGTVASHSTAAVLWGMPLPRRLHDAPLHLTRPVGGSRPRRKGVVGHLADLPYGATVTVYGVPLTTPARTWCDLATQLTTPELVAAGDALLRKPDAPRLIGGLALPNPLTTVELLTAELATRAGARGTGRARESLPLLRTGVDSVPETLLRLLIRDAGLPEPEVNRWITDVDGRRISRPDLQYRSRRIALEYEGEHHLTDARQWAHDIERDERLRALGWTVLRFTKVHLGEGRRDAVARIARALSTAEECGGVTGPRGQ